MEQFEFEKHLTEYERIIEEYITTDLSLFMYMAKMKNLLNKIFKKGEQYDLR